MDYFLVTSEDYEISCRCDLGNRWVVVNRADYNPNDDYIQFCGFSDDEEFEYEIISVEIVKETRNAVMLRLELDVEDDSDSDDDDEDSFGDELWQEYHDEQSFLFSSESESDSESDDDYWDEYNPDPDTPAWYALHDM